MSEMAQWADLFPHMPGNKATLDPRVFKTRWEKEGRTTKKRTYFACVVGGTCYGVDVMKPYYADTKVQERKAYGDVVSACNFFEDNGRWPNSL